MKKPAKAAVTLAVLFVALIALGMAFRQLLAITLLDLYLRPHNLQLNCLQFDINRRLDVHIKKLCIEHPNFNLTARNLRWTRASNQLSVELASVILIRDTTSPSAAQPVELNLPDALPLLDIKHLELHSDFTEQPLVLNIRQPSKHRFEVSSGWHASLELRNQQLSGEIDWQLSDLLPLGVRLASDGIEHISLNSGLKTRFNFDGETIHSLSQVNLEYQIAVAGCPIQITGAGEIGLVADLIANSAALDLRQFVAQGQWRDCPLQQNAPQLLQFKELNVAFSKPIKFTPAAMTLTGVTVTSNAIDNNGADLNLQFDNVTYEFEGGSSADFELRLNRDAALNLSSSGKISAKRDELRLNADTRVAIAKLEYQDIVADDLQGNFSLTYSLATGIQAQGKARLATLQKQSLKAVSLETSFNLTGADLNQLEIKLDNNIAQLTDGDIKLETVTNQSNLSLIDINLVVANGHSKIGNVVFRSNSFGKVTFAHSIKANIEQQQISSEQNISIGREFLLNLHTANRHARLDIDNQSLLKLDELLVKLTPSLSVQSGHITATIETDLHSLQPQGKISLTNANAKFADVAINELDYALEFFLDPAGLQLKPAQLTVKSLDVGFLIENIMATITGKNSRLQAYDMHGNTLDGQLGLDNLWLDDTDQQSLLTLQDIDIARLIALEKQSGIEVTGHLAGQLPLVLTDGRVSIRDGHLYNQHDGSIVINNNAAFDALKAQQPEISGQLALLEQLNFEKLEGTVNLAGDGLLNLDIAIAGINPVAGERVNFNYTHQENILVLLKALRLTDSITNKIEQRLVP